MIAVSTMFSTKGIRRLSDGQRRNPLAVPPRNSGRVNRNNGSGEDTESELVGRDIGIDGAAASAEEAAVHVIEDDY